MLQQLLSVVGVIISILLIPFYVVFLGLGVTPFFQRQFVYHMRHELAE